MPSTVSRFPQRKLGEVSPHYHRPGLWAMTFLLVIGGLLSTTNLNTAFASNTQHTPKMLGMHKFAAPQLGKKMQNTPHDGGPCSGCGTPPLKSQGGPVIHDPQVHLVFWGSWWNSNASEPVGIKGTLANLFTNLAGGQYNNILDQYTDTTNAPNNYVHNDITYVTSVMDQVHPIPVPLSMEQIGEEAIIASENNAWKKSDNTIIMVFPQPGTVYNSSEFDGACGMHAFETDPNIGDVVYGMSRYTPDYNCNYGGGSSVANMSMIAAHEYAEMATDPEVNFNTGWVTHDGFEIADLCDTRVVTYDSLLVTALWSNTASNSTYPNGQCMLANGQEYSSPDTASPFHGIHTVQGSILSKYQNLLAGGNGSYVGEPTSEETPIGDGRASYFVGSCNGGGPASSCAAIYWSPATGAYVDWGNDYLKYISEGGPAGNFGFPTTDPKGGVAGGAYSLFQGSSYCGTAGTVNGSCAAVFDKGGVGTFVDMGNDLSKYMSEGGPGGNFGYPITDPMGIAGGSYSVFQGSSYCGNAGTVDGGNCAAVFDKNGVGTFIDVGNDLYKYMSEGGPGGNFGYPTTDPIGAAGGSYSLFQGSSYCGAAGMVNGSCAAVFDKSGVGTFADWGDDLHKYMDKGGPGGTLGWPLSDPQGIPGGAVSYFTGNYGCGTPGPAGSDGAVYFNTSNGTANEVHGCIYAFYQLTSKGTGGVLGYPLSDETGITDSYGNSGRVNYFTGNYGCGAPGPAGSDGAIYWTGAGYQVYGCIYNTYIAHGGPGGVLGFPVSSEYTNALGYRETDFAYGDIVWENGQGVVTVF